MPRPKTCDCSEQDPRFEFPFIRHTCFVPFKGSEYLYDWEAYEQEIVDEGGATGLYPVKRGKPIYDALQEEIDRAPISRYMRGGVPAYEDNPPMMFQEDRCAE